MSDSTAQSTLQDSPAAAARASEVLRLAEFDQAALTGLLATFGLELTPVTHDAPIPGSFWGDEEAGLRGKRLFARADTPVHSILHESGHFVCMDPARRRRLDTNAGGDHAEENAVCYWQIAVTDHLRGLTRQRMCADMDAWGYSFRLGSAAAWFAHDAEDARAWLLHYGLLDAQGRVRKTVRERL